MAVKILKQAFQRGTQQYGSTSQIYHAKWGGKRKPDLKGYIVCDSIYVTFGKRQNDRDGNKVTNCQGLSSSRERD